MILKYIKEYINHEYEYNPLYYIIQKYSIQTIKCTDIIRLIINLTYVFYGFVAYR